MNFIKAQYAAAVVNYALKSLNPGLRPCQDLVLAGARNASTQAIVSDAHNLQHRVDLPHSLDGKLGSKVGGSLGFLRKGRILLGQHVGVSSQRICT